MTTVPDRQAAATYRRPRERIPRLIASYADVAALFTTPGPSTDAAPPPAS